MANKQEKILLTQDKDFGETVFIFRLKNVHFGVVLIRLNGYKPVEKASIVKKLFLKHQLQLVKVFTVIQPNAIRIRR